MATATATAMTVEEFLALPDDGRRRALIHGELREWDEMTIRNRFHSATMMKLGGVLAAWNWGRPAPRGEVVGGEAGIRLPGDPPVVIGADVAYVPPEVMARQTAESTLIEGVPAMVAEILSPSTPHGETLERIDVLIAAGVRVVWVLDPHHRTVVVHGPGFRPVMVNDAQELDGGDVLPGFRCPVARLFE